MLPPLAGTCLMEEINHKIVYLFPISVFEKSFQPPPAFLMIFTKNS